MNEIAELENPFGGVLTFQLPNITFKDSSKRVTTINLEEVVRIADVKYDKNPKELSTYLFMQLKSNHRIFIPGNTDRIGLLKLALKEYYGPAYNDRDLYEKKEWIVFIRYPQSEHGFSENTTFDISDLKY